MQLGRFAVAAACAAGLLACGVDVASINQRPDKYYQKKVTFSARVSRTQELTGVTLLEVTDQQGARILVRATPPVEAESGDWVKVEGVLVPEVRIQDVVVYDVIVAERVSRTHAPRLPSIM